MNIVFNLIDRAILLSDKRFHKRNISRVTEILIENSYPPDFIKKYTKARLFKINNTNDTNNKPLNTDIYNLKVALPFHSNFYNNCSKFLNKYNIQIISSIVNKLNKLVVLGKNKTNKLEQTNVVYELSCKDCDARYIGETERALNKRISEHRNNKNEKLYMYTKAHINMISTLIPLK